MALKGSSRAHSLKTIPNPIPPTKTHSIPQSTSLTPWTDLPATPWKWISITKGRKTINFKTKSKDLNSERTERGQLTRTMTSMKYRAVTWLAGHLLRRIWAFTATLCSIKAIYRKSKFRIRSPLWRTRWMVHMLSWIQNYQTKSQKNQSIQNKKSFKAPQTTQDL